MDWSEGFFEGDWLDVQRARYTEESAHAVASGLVERLSIRPGMQVLDVPCGNGRISLALARAGAAVTGVDRCGPLLEEARRDAAAEGLSVEWRDRDMRDLPWSGRFDVAINYWSSIGYFDDPGEIRFARALHDALKPGGALLVETLALETMCGWRSGDCTWADVGGVRVLERRTMDWTSGRMRTQWTFSRGDALTSRKESLLRIYSCSELVRLLREAGFRSFEAAADLKGTPFGPGTRLVLVARR